MAYPVRSYRQGSRLPILGGSNPRGSSGPGSQRPPVPANDNQPKPWTPPKLPVPPVIPANDNVNPNDRIRQGMRAINVLRAVSRIARFSTRLNPYLSVALTLLDLWSMWLDKRYQSIQFSATNEMDLTGYDLWRNCGGDGPAWTGGQLAGSCGATWFASDQLTGPPRPLYLQTFQPLFSHAILPDTIRVNAQNVYRRAVLAGPPVTKVIPTPMPGVNPVPVPLPGIDPFYWPPLSPVGPPVTLPYPLLPYRQPDPGLIPEYQTERGYGTSRVVVPGATNPGKEPGTPQNPNPGRQPARRGEKERKVKPTHAAARFVFGLQKVGHEITEALDVLDVTWKALPERYKPKGKLTPQQKAAVIYRHWDKIDTDKLVRGLILNQIEDAVIGRSNAKVNKFLRERVAPYTGNPLGLVRGRAF